MVLASRDLSAGYPPPVFLSIWGAHPSCLRPGNDKCLVYSHESGQIKRAGPEAYLFSFGTQHALIHSLLYDEVWLSHWPYARRNALCTGVVGGRASNFGVSEYALNGMPLTCGSEKWGE